MDKIEPEYKLKRKFDVMVDGKMRIRKMKIRKIGSTYRIHESNQYYLDLYLALLTSNILRKKFNKDITFNICKFLFNENVLYITYINYRRGRELFNDAIKRHTKNINTNHLDLLNCKIKYPNFLNCIDVDDININENNENFDFDLYRLFMKACMNNSEVYVKKIMNMVLYEADVKAGIIIANKNNHKNIANILITHLNNDDQ